MVEIPLETGGENAIQHYQIVHKTSCAKPVLKEQAFWKKHFPALIFDGRDYLQKALKAAACCAYCSKEDHTFIRHVFRRGVDLPAIYNYSDPFVEKNLTYYWWQKLVDIIEGSLCMS